MGYYKLLSTPISDSAPDNYKGLYRLEPFPKPDFNSEMILLWKQYIQYLDSSENVGIKNELSLMDLKKLCLLSTQSMGKKFEIIYFSDQFRCPYKSTYYGIDVTSFGGYSMIGEGFFNNQGNNDETYKFNILNNQYSKLLNLYGLFGSMDVASKFRDVLINLSNEYSQSIEEEEEWYLFHVFGIE